MAEARLYIQHGKVSITNCEIFQYDEGSYHAIKIVTGGNVTINGSSSYLESTISGSTIRLDGGTFTMSDGEILGSTDSPAIRATDGNINISGGKVYGYATMGTISLDTGSATVKVSGGIIERL